MTNDDNLNVPDFPISKRSHAYIERLRAKVNNYNRSVSDCESEKNAILEEIEHKDSNIKGLDAGLESSHQKMSRYSVDGAIKYFGLPMGLLFGGTIGYVSSVATYRTTDVFSPVPLAIGLIGGPLVGSAFFGLLAWAYKKRDLPQIENEISEQERGKVTQLQDKQILSRKVEAVQLKSDTIREELDNIKKELDGMIPELCVGMRHDVLMEDFYTPVQITLSNNGSGPAYNANCRIRGNVDGDTDMHFKTVEDVTLQKTVSLKPTEKGKMRWDFEISYSDAVGRHYNIKNEHWIDVQPSANTQIIGEVHGDVVGNKVSENINIKDSVISGSNIGTRFKRA